MYVNIKGFFPVADRELLFSRFDNYSPQFSYYVAFSIEREDHPPNPKYVRANMMGKRHFGGILNNIL